VGTQGSLQAVSSTNDPQSQKAGFAVNVVDDWFSEQDEGQDAGLPRG
jgi:hypothetical protein